MSGTTASPRRTIDTAGNPQSVVRTMKTLAGLSIGQFQQSACASGDDYRTVEPGLGVCSRDAGSSALMTGEKNR